MPIDDSSVKGRGAQTHLHNRFDSKRYVREHMEGIDTTKELGGSTKYLEVHPKSIVNPVPSSDLHFNWSMNPYQGCEHGCAYCYARPTHEYWGYNAGMDFEQVILIKRNAASLLTAFLSRRDWNPEMIVLSGATDPYQPIERTEKVSRGLLKVMLDHRAPLGIITKNALLLRDIDLLAEMAAMNLVHVSISITTLNEGLRRKLEPRTSSGRKRLEAVERLSKAGVPVHVMLAPIIPTLNTAEVADIVKASADCGAQGISYILLRLNGSVAPVFTGWLNQYYPDRADRIINQVMDTHGGHVSDHRAGVRMKGEGNFAKATSDLFRINKERFFAGRAMPVLDTSRFRSLRNGQLDLFND